MTVLAFPREQVDLQEFKSYLVGEGLADASVKVYLTAMRRAAAAADERGWSLAALTPLQARELTNSWASSHSARGILKASLTKYWAMVGVDGPAKAIRVPKTPRYKFRGLEEDEARQLAAVACGWRPQGLVVLLGLYLGLRRTEMASLKWSDFTDNLEWVSITGKGEVTRELPVVPALRHELAVWRETSSTVRLFPGRADRTYVHSHTIRVWVGKVCEEAGVGWIAPHQLRHTALASMNDETGDLRTTQYFAGHSSPMITANYTRATQRRVLEAAAALAAALDS